MSTAVRLKAHHFWQNTLLSRCTGWLLKLWHRAADIVRALPVVPFTALTLAAWLGHGSRGIVQAATGTGKTALATAAVDELLQKHSGAAGH